MPIRSVLHAAQQHELCYDLRTLLTAHGTLNGYKTLHTTFWLDYPDYVWLYEYSIAVYNDD